MEDRESYLPPVALGEPGVRDQLVRSPNLVMDSAVGDIVQTTGGWQDFVVAAPGQGPMGLSKVPDGVTPEMMLSVLVLLASQRILACWIWGSPRLPKQCWCPVPQALRVGGWAPY